MRFVTTLKDIFKILCSPRIRKLANEDWQIRKIGEQAYWTGIAKSHAKSCGNDLRVNHACQWSGEIHFGNNCNFNGMNVLGRGKVTFGDNFHSGIDCMIITQNHNYDHGTQIPYDSTYTLKEVIIEDNVWLCNRVVIVGNIRIGEGAIVAAGAVVTKDVPKYAIVGGNPAMVIKYRDVKHYKDLKSQKKFH